jgi:hypothetical protein
MKDREKKFIRYAAMEVLLLIVLMTVLLFIKYEIQ